MIRFVHILLLATLTITFGCASLEKCGVFYEAHSLEDKATLIARLDVLRSRLISDSRLKEEPDRDYRVRFFGVHGSEFEYLAVSASILDGSPSLVIGCPYKDRNSERVTKLRKIVEEAIGADLAKRLKVEVRHSTLARKEVPNQRPQRNASATVPVNMKSPTRRG